ncbi:MAG: hypothetical protein ACK4N5_05360, partial [Myxococcales bacterium]
CLAAADAEAGHVVSAGGAPAPKPPCETCGGIEEVCGRCGKALQALKEQSANCACPWSKNPTMRCPKCAPTPKPKAAAERCDHKFVDSKRCLKCGWQP